MTHPPGQPGGGGGSNGGQTGPGRITAAYDRTVDVLADAFGRAYGRLVAARLSGDRVTEADAKGSLVDLRTAAHIRGGASPDALDRNGWPVRVSLPNTRGDAPMRNYPDPDGTVPTGGKANPYGGPTTNDGTTPPPPPPPGS
jgi:hypothetical protein